MSGSDQSARALDGVRVLEFAALIAGPSCAKYLADHGAEVIKFERFPDGDVSRHSFTASAPGRSPMYLQQNAGKKSLCVDLKRAEGLAIAQELAATADVVIEAFTPGVMARLGLGYEALKAVNPRVILCSVSGFGQTGPNAGLPGYAHVAHAMTGWLAMQFLHRDPPEIPRGPGIAIGDTTAGLTAFGAVCAALFRRERTGQGEHIDIALFDSLFGSNDFTLQAALQGDPVGVWYHPVHATKDGYVTATVGPDHGTWRNVCRAMNRPDLLEDERFDDQDSLREHIVEASAIATEWLAGLTCEEARQVLGEHHIPCAKVLTVDEAVAQPQVQGRQLTVAVDDPVFGPMQVVNSAFRYTESAAGVREPAPALGQHNVEVLREQLGYDEARIQRLLDGGVLRSSDR